VPDAIVSFWIAIEGLEPAEGKDIVKSVNDTLHSAGFDVTELAIPVCPLPSEYQVGLAARTL
jgi:hypothetical protein